MVENLESMSQKISFLIFLFVTAIKYTDKDRKVNVILKLYEVMIFLLLLLFSKCTSEILVVECCSKKKSGVALTQLSLTSYESLSINE